MGGVIAHVGKDKVKESEKAQDCESGELHQIQAALADFPFRNQPASHDAYLIIEAEGKTRAETGHHNCHCSCKPN